MLASGVLNPPRPQIYPFDEVGKAMRDLMERRVIGKAVLSVG
jgi:NADPH:quinone reductase-like Zn-dependent oxidoreductase